MELIGTALPTSLRSFPIVHLARDTLDPNNAKQKPRPAAGGLVRKEVMEREFTEAEIDEMHEDFQTWHYEHLKREFELAGFPTECLREMIEGPDYWRP